jgi:hypothetical protein
MCCSLGSSLSERGHYLGIYWDKASVIQVFAVNSSWASFSIFVYLFCIHVCFLSVVCNVPCGHGSACNDLKGIKPAASMLKVLSFCAVSIVHEVESSLSKNEELSPGNC